MRPRYLFIRILEACNANCFMCDFALSRDSYRFSIRDLRDVLSQASLAGVHYVRFTGGEPLLHQEIVPFVRIGTMAGMKLSVITNGSLLPKMIDELADAGLAQVIVSIDGASAETHDGYRGTAGLFHRCLKGLRRARERGVQTRVNTVVGPYNYEEMPRLQERLTELGVEQWELSAIKLERRIVYAEPEHVRAICDPLYEADPLLVLVPLGKRFYGDTVEEQALFFESGITPRPSAPCCNLVGDVIYIDAKAGLGYGCSLLPHRSAEESGGGIRMRIPTGWRLDSREFGDHVIHFRRAGPRECRGCSTTAAGYSDEAAFRGAVRPWAF
jgi:cytosylglucuronate decarboxylase